MIQRTGRGTKSGELCNVDPLAGAGFLQSTGAGKLRHSLLALHEDEENWDAE